jgi:hypothetical protein
MQEKITLHHHHNKIKFGLIFFVLIIVIYVGFTTASSYLAYYGGGQCRDIFDLQPLENRQRICCDADHYGYKDTLCKVKCDALDVNPDSAFCKNLKNNQAQSPIAQEISKAKPLSKESPKCTNFKIVNYDKNEKENLLKPSNPLNIQMKVEAKDIQPRYFVYEFFTIQGNDIYSIKPISFEKGKTFMAINPAKYSSNGLYTDSMTVLHNFFFNENLNEDKKVPSDVLIVSSIIDEKGNKQLQPTSCFARFTIDQTPSYCKSFSVSQGKLESDGTISVSIESKSPTNYSYEFNFLNLKNYETSNGDKIYKPISYDYVNGKKVPYTVSKLANGNSKMTFDLKWTDLYQRDLNFNNKYPKNIRIEAYIKPYLKSSLEELVPCRTDITLGGDEGLDYCKDISISGGTKNSDGSTSLKSGQYITIKSQANIKNINNFSYTFHNLNNLDSDKTEDGVKDAGEIYFSKSDPFEINKSSSKTDSKSILISYDDINKIDLSAGSKPTNIQVRAFFTSTDGRSSKLDSDCVTSFKVE